MSSDSASHPLSNEESPRVSIIVPNYNHARFLEERLTSIINQTYRNYELIVLDDHSTDHSVETIETILANEEYLLEVNLRNSGSTFLQWAKGIEMASGELIWIAESDDSAEPRLLEELVRRFKDPSVSLAYCQSMDINTTSEIGNTWKAWTDDLSNSLWKDNFLMNGGFFIENFLGVKNSIPNASAVVFRRDRCSTRELKHSRFKVSTDWLFWKSVAETGTIAHVAEPLNRFRSHPQTVRNRNIELILQEMISTSHAILISGGYAPEDELKRRLLARSLARRWRDCDFHLSSYKTWRQHKPGVALLLTLLRRRRILLACVIEDLHTRVRARMA
jgi:glycosyltransferase involved in cell wall biosynthesis